MELTVPTVGNASGPLIPARVHRSGKQQDLPSAGVRLLATRRRQPFASRSHLLRIVGLVQQHAAFDLAWRGQCAQQYSTGASIFGHLAWRALLHCPVLRWGTSLVLTGPCRSPATFLLNGTEKPLYGPHHFKKDSTKGGSRIGAAIAVRLSWVFRPAPGRSRLLQYRIADAPPLHRRSGQQEGFCRARREVAKDRRPVRGGSLRWSSRQDAEPQET